MSNAANKNGDKSEALAVLSSISEEAKDKIAEPISDPVESNTKVSGSNADLNSTQAPHLVVVTPDALNAERMGPRLRAAREIKGWTLEAAAKETRIHKDYLGAIEDMMPNLLPGMPKSQSYLRGYLNNYARALGLPDPQDVVQRFLNECGLLAMEPTAEERAIEAKKTEEKARRNWVAPVLTAVAATLIACAAGGALVLKPWEKADTVSVANRAPVEENTVYSSRAEVLAPASASDLSLYATTRAWIEVRGSDGTVYLSRELAPGDVYVPRIGAGWTVTARDGGAFEWHLSGVSLGTLGPAGMPVYSHGVDEALTRQPLEGNDLVN